MKKIIAISACLLMLMSFAACGGGEYVEYVPEETNEDGEIIIDGENDEWDVFNEEE